MKAILAPKECVASVGVELFVKRLFLAVLPPGEILKQDGKVYTQVVSNCSARTLLPILEQFSDLENSTIFSDSWKAYDRLAHYGAKEHFRVKHCENEFANGKNHINGIENFWGYAKHRLSKFKGIKRQNFTLHLKERKSLSKFTKTLEKKSA